MIQYLVKQEGQIVPIDTIRPGCWVNVYPPYTKEELTSLSVTLDIPVEFFLDSLDMDERSRFERDDDVELIVMNTPIKTSIEEEINADFITIPIGIINVKECIITISGSKNPVIDFFMDRMVKGFNPEDKSNFILRLLDKNIYYFIQYLKRINLQRNIYEQELFNSSRNKELSKLMKLQKSLIYFATTLRDLEVMVIKIQRTNFLKIKQSEEYSDFLDDILIDTSQAREMSDIYTNIISTTVDSYASIISNNMNLVMKRLTSVTIILMVPTLVASFYGMNVKLPFESHDFAYLIMIGISILLAIIVVYIFRKNELF